MSNKLPGRRSGSGAASVLQHIAAQREADSAAAPTPASRSSHTILVVDDHEALLYATTRMLEGAGYRTLQTTSGEEAILRASEADALVLDVNLPDVNGVAVLQAVRRLGWTDLPVILTSAIFVTEIHRQVGLESGADAYLIGPLDPQELTSTLDRLLEARA
jgi:DNA-binding response OmpR family regulator